MTLAKKSFKDLSTMAECVAKRYFLARRVHQIKTGQVLCENDYDDESTFDFYINKVLAAFESLNEKEKNLINNEFFFQSYQDWWKSVYTKPTFYRYKKQAMLRFLGAFYHV